MEIAVFDEEGSKAAFKGAPGEQGGAAREHWGSMGEHRGSIEGALQGGVGAQQIGAWNSFSRLRLNYLHYFSIF